MKMYEVTLHCFGGDPRGNGDYTWSESLFKTEDEKEVLNYIENYVNSEMKYYEDCEDEYELYYSTYINPPYKMEDLLKLFGVFYKRYQNQETEEFYTKSISVTIIED